jgi:tRNA (cmo5U34)-methyltransferase
MSDPVPHFSDAQSVATYAENATRLVPGLAALHRMTLLLIAEHAPPDARVLVLGAGGGMELKVFAENQQEWQFDGVDPAPAMLALAEQTLGPLMGRVSLHQGYIDIAPQGPFDAATCLLTLHFLSREERLRTLREIRRRLKPGAPFVMAHHSFPQDDKGRETWPRRFAAFALASGVETAKASIFAQLPLLSPEDEENLLREAGFTDVALFYAAFTFRGWVAAA